MVNYTDIKVNISENQRNKIKTAIEKGTGTTIQFSIEDLKFENPSHTLAFTKTQIDKLAEALKNEKGVRIAMSKTQLAHNKTIEGGFIGSLIAAAASAALPPLINFISDKISGKGIYLKRGDGFLKLRQMGDGLYLRPYNATPYDISGAAHGPPADGTSPYGHGSGATTGGDGLYFKNGSSYELIKDGSINDIQILAQLLK